MRGKEGEEKGEERSETELELEGEGKVEEGKRKELRVGSRRSKTGKDKSSGN